MITANDLEYVREHVRQVPNFPKEGILFLDVTNIAGIESRGFIFGAPLACRLNAGFITIRKPNKLPADTIKETYSLEYGTDTIEMHSDAVKPGDRVVVIDDLLATGGTAAAACNLVKKAGAEVAAAAFIIELPPLKGKGLFY